MRVDYLSGMSGRSHVRSFHLWWEGCGLRRARVTIVHALKCNAKPESAIFAYCLYLTTKQCFCVLLCSGRCHRAVPVYSSIYIFFLFSLLASYTALHTVSWDCDMSLIDFIYKMSLFVVPSSLSFRSFVTIIASDVYLSIKCGCA